MDNFWPANFAAWTTLVASVVAALWAVLTFSRNNRIKAAEILLAVEKDYSRHLKTLLQLEHRYDYHRIYKKALKKAVDHTLGVYTTEESDAIDRLEDTLRYFFVCINIKSLSVDGGAIDKMSAYYLRILVSEKRPELKSYVNKYWPSVYYWGLVAGLPWPRRIVVYLQQMPKRLKSWWTASFAKSDILYETAEDISGPDIKDKSIILTDDKSQPIVKSGENADRGFTLPQICTPEEISNDDYTIE